MRNLLILMAVLSGVYFWYFYGVSPFDSYTTLDNGDIVISKAGNEFTFADLGDFSADLRVFGTAEFDADSDKDIAPYPLLATSMAENSRTFKKFICEINSLKTAALVNVIPATSSLYRKMKNYKGGNDRTCFNIVGRSLYLKGFNQDAGLMMNVRTKLLQMNRQYRFEPRRYIFMTELTEIECE